jgi:hypothetical protein
LEKRYLDEEGTNSEDMLIEVSEEDGGMIFLPGAFACHAHYCLSLSKFNMHNLYPFVELILFHLKELIF